MPSVFSFCGEYIGACEDTRLLSSLDAVLPHALWTLSDAAMYVNALFNAVILGDVKLMNIILNTGVSVDTTDSNRRTILHFAMVQNLSDLVPLLIRYNCNLNAVDKDGNTVCTESFIVLASCLLLTYC